MNWYQVTVINSCLLKSNGFSLWLQGPLFSFPARWNWEEQWEAKWLQVICVWAVSLTLSVECLCFPLAPCSGLWLPALPPPTQSTLHAVVLSSLCAHCMLSMSHSLLWKGELIPDGPYLLVVLGFQDGLQWHHYSIFTPMDNSPLPLIVLEPCDLSVRGQCATFKIWLVIRDQDVHLASVLLAFLIFSLCLRISYR